MIKNKVSLEVDRNDRKYMLIMDCDSPLGEIFDVICMMKNEIIQRIKMEEEKKEDAKEV